MTWPESVDEALCFGCRRHPQAHRRRQLHDSLHPCVAQHLSAVTPRARAGARRGGEDASGDGRRSARGRRPLGIYAYEQRSATLPEPYAKRMKTDKAAWTFFQAQPPWYRKVMGWWVVSAKKEETRLKRLGKLIEDSAQGRRLR